MKQKAIKEIKRIGVGEVAEAIGVATNTLYAIMSGRQKLTEERLGKLRTKLPNISLSDLIWPKGKSK